MPFSGDVFTRLYNWVTDRNNGVKIQAVRMDQEFDGIATALSTLKAADTLSLKKDGSATVTANIPFANFRLTGIGDATALTDALNKKTADKAVTTAGTSTAYTATSGYSLTDVNVQDGTTIRIRPHTASGATPTLAVDTMTARAIRRQDGLQIGASELVANSTYELAFRVADTSWYLIGAALPTISGNANRLLRVNPGGTAFEFTPTGSITRSGRTSNTILGTADNGAFIDITSGTFSQTFTAAATLGNGWWCYIRNAGTGDITLDPNSTETIDGLTSFIMYPGEARLIMCDGSAFYSSVLTPFSRTFTASGTFTKPPGYAVFQGLLWGGGGGGGRSNSANGVGGGGGGACVPFWLLASSVGTTETVTIGAGGTAQTGSGNGGAGGTSTLGSLVSAFGGGGGGGGSGSNLQGGTGGGALSAGTVGGTGTDAGGNPGGGNTDPTVRVVTGQGLGGAGYSQTSAFGGAGAGGASNQNAGGSVYGGGGGAGISTGGATGTAGTSRHGGAGGACSVSGNGSDGSAPGGGGGATQTGTTSGAGGRGELRIWGLI